METAQTTTAQIAASKKALRQLEYKLFQESGKKSKRPVRTTKEMRAAKYKTNNGLTIHELRRAGNTVKITHIRYASMEGVGTLVPVPSYLRKLTSFYPRGGVTYVLITTPERDVHSTVSVCHEHDCFDYRLGVKLALDRITPGQAAALLAPLQAIEESAEVPKIVDTESKPCDKDSEDPAPCPCPLTGIVPELTKSCMV